MILFNFSDLISTFGGKEEWIAVLGSEDRSKRKVVLPIESVFIHPNFVNYQNDIGKVLCMKRRNAENCKRVDVMCIKLELNPECVLNMCQSLSVIFFKDTMKSSPVNLNYCRTALEW